MKRYLLFAWPAGGNWPASHFAGFNSYRGGYDNFDMAALAFNREFELYEHGQIVDIETGDLTRLDQLKDITPE